MAMAARSENETIVADVRRPRLLLLSILHFLGRSPAPFISLPMNEVLQAWMILLNSMPRFWCLYTTGSRFIWAGHIELN